MTADQRTIKGQSVRVCAVVDVNKELICAWQYGRLRSGDYIFRQRPRPRKRLAHNRLRPRRRTPTGQDRAGGEGGSGVVGRGEVDGRAGPAGGGAGGVGQRRRGRRQHRAGAAVGDAVDGQRARGPRHVECRLRRAGAPRDRVDGGPVHAARAAGGGGGRGDAREKVGVEFDLDVIHRQKRRHRHAEGRCAGREAIGRPGRERGPSHRLCGRAGKCQCPRTVEADGVRGANNCRDVLRNGRGAVQKKVRPALPRPNAAGRDRRNVGREGVEGAVADLALARPTRDDELPRLRAPILATREVHVDRRAG